MVDIGRSPVGALSRRLQTISESGWANIQVPVREGFEAVETTVNGLRAELASSREEVKRLEARLAGMENALLRRVDSSARSVREEIDALRTAFGAVPGLAEMRSAVSKACRVVESTVLEKARTMDRKLADIHDESRKAIEAARQASAGKAGLADLEAFYPRTEAASRSDLLDLEGKVVNKADQASVDTALATKVSWADLERLLREKADACGLAELESTCVKVAALERVELGLVRAVGMEEVRAFVETQTGGVQAMSPALERLLATRGKEEREAAEKGPASAVTRFELPGLIQTALRQLKHGDGEEMPPRANAAQVQAAISAGRESTLRTVEGQLARARGAQQEQAQFQENRLRMEFEENIGRVRGRVEELGRGLERTKGELVSLQNEKAYKADLSLGLQGKADTKDLETTVALLRSKVDESDYRETCSRTAHQLTALSAEVGGVRAELRTDVGRLSSGLLTKADSDEVLAVRRAYSEAAATATAAASAAAVAELDARDFRNARWAPCCSSQPQERIPAAADFQSGRGAPCHSAQPQERSPAGGVGGGEEHDTPRLPPGKGSTGPRGRAGVSISDTREISTRGGPSGSGLSREEARLLIRAELKRAGISDKITREEAAVQAEACASKALSMASRAVDAVDQRLRSVSEGLSNSKASETSEPEIRRLCAAQSSLELRFARSLSLGRWLWCGEHGGVVPVAEHGGGQGGVWVPWETEDANASPECLLWNPGGTAITVTVPGLYLLSCGFFSQGPFSVTVHLNGEPVYSFLAPRMLPLPSPESSAAVVDGLDRRSDQTPRPPLISCLSAMPQPPPPPPPLPPCTEYVDNHAVSSSSGGVPDAQGVISGGGGYNTTENRATAAGSQAEGFLPRPASPPLEDVASSKDNGRGKAVSSETRRRYRHPAGEVLSTSVREYVALPTGGVVGVKFEGLLEKAGGVAVRAQGFLELHKM